MQNGLPELIRRNSVSYPLIDLFLLLSFYLLLCVFAVKIRILSAGGEKFVVALFGTKMEGFRSASHGE